MNTIIIYQSVTGFTKQYGEWLAEDLDCRAVSLKKVSAGEAEAADLIIFGGWVMANMISGLDKIRKMNPQKLVVFAVGSMPETIADAAAMKTQNHLEAVPFFYMTGGIRFEQMGFVKRTMLKTLRRAMAKESNPTPQATFMAKALETSFDYSGKEQIQPLVRYVRGELE